MLSTAPRLDSVAVALAFSSSELDCVDATSSGIAVCFTMSQASASLLEYQPSEAAARSFCALLPSRSSPVSPVIPVPSSFPIDIPLAA